MRGVYLNNPFPALAGAARAVARSGRLPDVPRSLSEALTTEDPVFMLRPMHRHPWVYRAIDSKQKAMLQIPFRFHERLSDGNSKPAPNYVVAKLLENPNPRLSTRALMAQTEQYLQYRGNAYWLVIRGDTSKQPIMVGNLRPERVKVVAGKDGSLLGYVYRMPMQDIALDVTEVVHFKLNDVEDDYYGLSPLEVLRLTIQDDMAARAWNYQLLRNQAIPRGALMTDKPLTITKAEEIRAIWEKAHNAGGSGRIAVLHSGTKYAPVGMTTQEMDYLARLKMNREETGGIYGVTPIFMHDYGEATYNNAREQFGMFWRETMSADGAVIADTITANLEILGGAPGDKYRYYCREDLSRIHALRRDELDLANTQVALVTSGLRRVNELRGFDGLDDVEWGDTWFRSITLVPWDSEQDAPAITASVQASVLETPPDEATVLEADNADPEWRAYAVQSMHFEKVMAGFLKLVFEAQHNEVRARLVAFDKAHRERTGEAQRRPPRTDGEIASVLFDLDDANRVVAAESEPLFRRVLKRGGERGYKQTGQAGAFDITDPRAAEYLRNKPQNFAEKINETTWTRLQEKLAEAADQGLPFDDILALVDEAKGGRVSNRWGIARTEINGGLNGGAFMGYQQSGIVIGKDWLDAGDQHVRQTHTDVASVSLEMPFMVGGETLMHPGDQLNGATAKEVAECRCSMKPKLRKKE